MKSQLDNNDKNGYIGVRDYCVYFKLELGR